MGHEKAVRLLKANLEEEKSADSKLMDIALSQTNEKAAQNKE